MEDVLGVSTRPYDPLRPQVCLDETSRQLLGEAPHPCRRRQGGRRGRTTSTCGKGGATCSWCASRCAAGGTLPVASDAPASTGRTPVKDLVDVHYPDAEQVVLVQDNPEHPHARVAGCGVRAGRCRAAGRAAGAALHPRHGSWLNMAEIELAVLAQRCLDRRLADQATLEREVAAWQAARNRAGRGVNWRFTTEDARIKLKHLYPTTQG
jgi:hypothetical protein